MSEVKKTGTSGTIPFSEDHFSYDTNGNLTLATRRSGTEIEAKTESYSRVGNRIDRLLIADEDEDPDQFTYDMNGAVTYDGYAHCWITSNVLGLAGEMWFEDGSFRGNRYLADGTKFACIDNDDYGTGLLYRGSMVYRSDWDEDLEDYAEHFESAAHPEGRFFAESFTPSGQPVLNSWHYVTDQIGSTVALVDMDMMAAEEEDAARERNEYCAYGARIEDTTFPKILDNRYRFNGKEEVENSPGPYIDYGARVYSPSLRQWLSPDPLADKYHDFSPYAFCADDPVNRVDPDGREIRGVTTNDASKVVDDLQEIFIDDAFALFRQLIKRSGKKGKGKSLAKISSAELEQAFSGIDLNADQKALVEMVVNTINSRDKHVIEFTGIVLSKEGDLAFADKLSEAGLPVDLIRERNDGIPVSIIASFFGEGATTETVGGTHTVIITSMSHPFSRSLTTGHELFGHGRSLSLGEKSNSTRRCNMDRESNPKSYGHI